MLRLLIPATLGLGLLLVVWQSALLARDQALEQLGRDAENELRLSSANLTGYLSRHDYLPHLIATRESVRRFLAEPPRAREPLSLNRLLDHSRARAEVSDIYLLDRRGNTIATSNWERPDSFMGQNYAFRSYYRQAINGQRGRFHGLGTRSDERGYYFSAPAYAADTPPGAPPDGVVVIKIALAAVEREWQRLEADLLVTDINGVIFMASAPSLRLNTLVPLSQNARRGLMATRRYAGETLPPASIQVIAHLDRQSRLIRLVESESEPARRYLSLSQPLSRFNWQLHILKPLTPVIRAQWLGALGAGGLYVLLALAGGITWQRKRLRGVRERFAERERQTLARARDELEGHVASRTEALTSSNRRLLSEIEERRRIEKSLRQTRDELVQAARMAVLGQMAASINHELNQPLTAIRAYADNARLLIERGRTSEAEENLHRIAALVERMASISAQLRQFSRQSGEVLTDVSVQACLEYALRLFQSRLQKANVRLDYRLGEAVVWTRADPVRLEQVLVNLIGNALQAMSQSEAPELILSAEQRGETVILGVADSGPGIADDALGRLFEPFFTTKPAGQGLGLGLSISQRIARDLGGHLEACNRPEGGALFTLYLPAAGAPLPRRP